MHLQRNAYHNYILNNNFKFYIFQFFRVFNFLSAVFGFAKISSFIKESKSSYFFEWQKSKHAKGGQSSKTISFCQKEDKAKARFQRKTTPFRIRNSLVKTMSLRGDSRSNPNLIKFDFYNLISLINKFYTKWIATPSLRSARNDNFNYIYAFSCALKNKFEIISRNENYAFNHNKYFCRNGNNLIGGRLPRLLTKSRNDKCVGCNDGFIARKNDLFSRNDYGGKFIFGFWNNLNFGFLFNRKTKKNKFMSAHSVGEGEQK